MKKQYKNAIIDGLKFKKDNSNIIAWSTMVGDVIKVLYNNRTYKIHILGIDDKKRICYALYKTSESYEEWQIFKSSMNSFKNVNIGLCVGEKLIDYLDSNSCFEIDYCKNFKELNFDKAFINKLNKTSKNKIYFRCRRCGDVSLKSIANVGNGMKCSVCLGKKCNKDINSIAKLRPDLIDYFVNKNDALSFTIGSEKKVKLKCINCGLVKYKSIKDFCKKGFACNQCNDGISIPEKFLSNILLELNVDFKRHCKFEWSNNRIYDFYLPKYNCLIETHGGQHFNKNGFITLGGRSLKEEKENDKIKRNLALKNGILNYIEIDCRNSEFNWLMNNVCKDLGMILENIELVDFNKCYLLSLKSQIHVVWDMYTKGLTAKKISDMLNLSRATIDNYIKLGLKLNKITHHKNVKNIKCILNGKVVLFNNFSEAARYYNVSLKTIIKLCKTKMPYSAKYYNSIKSIDGLVVSKIREV